MKHIDCENFMDPICAPSQVAKGFWPAAMLPKWSSNKSHVILEVIMKTQYHLYSTTNASNKQVGDLDSGVQVWIFDALPDFEDHTSAMWTWAKALFTWVTVSYPIKRLFSRQLTQVFGPFPKDTTFDMDPSFVCNISSVHHLCAQIFTFVIAIIRCFSSRRESQYFWVG